MRRSEWPELWWATLILCFLGLGGEAIAAVRGSGPVAFVCAVVLAVQALVIWRRR